PEYELRDEFDCAWAARPLTLAVERRCCSRIREANRLRGSSTDRWNWSASCATNMVAAFGKARQRGLVPKDIKPANRDRAGAARARWCGAADRRCPALHVFRRAKLG